MPNIINWATIPASRGNVLAAELNALADAARSDQGTEIDNSVNLDTYGMLELNVDPTAAFGINAFVALYLITAPDGSNYGDGSSSIDPGADTWLLNIPLRAVATAQQKMTKVFPLPPAKFKMILENQAGLVFPSAGTTVELFTMNYEVQ